ncbi:hypothetical protein V1514DRAFT_327760 [Lipomyces japonicus]|uniref:uncharacterized protein n=1 Tax=Lipomyces japonicus TaxID=56871 RepID=UPI0034CF575C
MLSDINRTQPIPTGAPASSSRRKSSFTFSSSSSRPVPSRSFATSAGSSIPVSPNLFPFSPLTGGVSFSTTRRNSAFPPSDDIHDPASANSSNVKILRDRRRRGSSVITTTILSPYDGDLMFSSSLDEYELRMNEDDEMDDEMEADMDVDEIDLNYHSDTDEEDWQSAGVESLRRGDAFHKMHTNPTQSVSSSTDSSRASVSSTGTADTKFTSYGQSFSDHKLSISSAAAFGSTNAKGFKERMENDRQDREAEAVQALVQLRSL